MQSEADWRIPDPDYDRHPAYGGLFGRPSLADRVTALARLLPHLGAYAAYDLVSRARSHAVGSDASLGSPVLDALRRDGVTALRFTPGEMEAIQAALAPFIAELRNRMGLPVVAGAVPAPAHAGRARRRGNGALPRNGTLGALHKQFNPHSTDNELFIHADAGPAVLEALRTALRKHGALEAASRYQGRPLDVTYVKLLINHADDRWWRAPFADLGLADPPAISMHVDHLWTCKAILYLSPVGAESGPFCYCLGSNHVRIGWLEGAARRANDRVDLSSCTPDSRRLFHALPEPLRRKAKFGNDLEGDHPELARLLASERRFTSADGNLILFDDRGIHRGGMVEAGERCMLQIRLA
jgi:hypothetical protein